MILWQEIGLGVGFYLFIQLTFIPIEMRKMREAYERRTDLLFPKKKEEGFPDGIEGLRLRKLEEDRKMKVR
jgi:hypothetical protein